MEKHRVLLNDPRIMEPLEEFLRTVREVVQVEKFDSADLPLPAGKGVVPDNKVPRFYHWW